MKCIGLSDQIFLINFIKSAAQQRICADWDLNTEYLGKLGIGFFEPAFYTWLNR